MNEEEKIAKRRERARLRQAKLRKEHPELIKAQMAEYRRKNKDKLRAANKKWAEDNKERMQEYRKRYAVENKDRIKEKLAIYHKEWYKRTKDKRQAQIKRWRDSNPQKLEAARNRRRHKFATRPKPLSCEITGIIGKLTYDHDHNLPEEIAFRGWILDQCNRIAGQANDDFVLLRLIADYLERNWIANGRPDRNSILVQERADAA